DLVIEKAMERVRLSNEEGKPLPTDDAGLRRLAAEPRGHERLKLHLFDLQRWVLWHLSVIGQPVEADILARCPLMKKPLGDVFAAAADVKKAVKQVQCILDLLENRCLVFRLRPRAPAPANDGTGLARYAIHHLVQRHVFLRLGGPFVEPSEANQFTVTMF